MADVTVSQFAEVLKVPVDRLLVQLDQAGIKVDGPNARISDDAKLELLTHLRRSHGSGQEGSAPNKITLRRKTQQEIKLASAQGRARTVNVEVRQKKTYIKRDVLQEQALSSRMRSTRSAARPMKPCAPRRSGSKPSAANTSAWRRRIAAASRKKPTARSKPPKMRVASPNSSNAKQRRASVKPRVARLRPRRSVRRRLASARTSVA